jgi:hypothetical protein
MAPGFSAFGARFANARFIRGIGPSDQRPDRHRDEARSMHLRNHPKGKDSLSRLLTPRAERETDEPETGEPEAGEPETGELADDDPSAGGLSAAVGDMEPIDDADAILAENLTDGDDGEAQAAEFATAPAPEAAGSSGLLARICGAALLLAGVLVAVLQGRGAIPPALAYYGLHPQTLFTVGAVVLGVGMVRRQVRALGATRRDEVLEHLQFLVEHQRATAERPPAKGEELDRVLAQLERQDEKVNNLTKALKAYGKPLLEIASSSADVTAQIDKIRTQSDALVDGLRSGQQRVEAAVRGAGSGEAVAALRDQSAKLEKQLHDQFAAIGEKVGHGGLQQQLTRMEASVQAIGQRLDDSEVRKSLLRLEEAEKARGRKLDEVARAETLQHDVARLEQRIDQNAGKLGATLEQVRNGNLGQLETSVRDMQRELAGLCTAVAQIQQAVRSGGMRAAAPAQMAAPMPAAAALAPAAEPPHAAAVAPPAPAHAAPAAAHAAAHEPAPAVDTKGLSDAQAGVAQNQTGARASTGKNVLGAIAKLKKMKT